MTGEPVIIFDTNSLRQIGWNAPAFRQLVELSSLGSIRVYVPEIVYHERRTQWRDEFQKASIQTRKALERYAEDPIFSPADQAAYAALLAALPEPDAETRSHASFERFFAGAGFRIVKIRQAHTDEAFQRYFAGTTPFKDVKARSDLPDGFVFAAMADVAKREGRAYCLCADKELAGALGTLPGVTVLPGVEEVMKVPDLVALRDELETNRAWLAVRDAFPMVRARAELTGWVMDRATGFLANSPIWSEKIPSDGNEGVISLVDEPEKVTISEFTDWGSGDLSASISFTCGVELAFQVFRGDAYAVPEWVSVVDGDFEADDYFDASGTALVGVKLDVSFEAVIADDYAGIDEVVDRISLDHAPRIRFLGGI